MISILLLPSFSLFLTDHSLNYHTQWRDLDKQEEDEHREIQYCRIIRHNAQYNILIISITPSHTYLRKVRHTLHAKTSDEAESLSHSHSVMLRVVFEDTHESIDGNSSIEIIQIVAGSEQEGQLAVLLVRERNLCVSNFTGTSSLLG